MVGAGGVAGWYGPTCIETRRQTGEQIKRPTAISAIRLVHGGGGFLCPPGAPVHELNSQPAELATQELGGVFVNLFVYSASEWSGRVKLKTKALFLPDKLGYTYRGE